MIFRPRDSFPLLKIGLNSVLVEKYQAPGIAFSTSLVTVFNFLFLAVLLRKKIGCLGWMKHFRTLIKMAIITLIMYLFGLLFLNIFPIHLIKFDIFSKSILIFTSFSTCFLVYFGLALTLRIEEAEKVFNEIKRKLSN